MVCRMGLDQAEAEIKKQLNLVKVGQLAIKNLEIELDQYKTSTSKQDKVILALEKESQKFGAEASAIAAKCMHVRR